MWNIEPYNFGVPQTLNHPSTQCGTTPENLCVTDLSSYNAGNGIVNVQVESKNQIYLGLKHIAIQNLSSFFDKKNYENFMSKLRTEFQSCT